jgi:[ribosomal protein S5]-alanine N-acetyltransferase
MPPIVREPMPVAGHPAQPPTGYRSGFAALPSSLTGCACLAFRRTASPSIVRDGHAWRVGGEPWLTTARLTLQPPALDDLDRVFAVHSDPLTYRHHPSGRMTSPDQAPALLAAWMDHWEAYSFGYASVQLRAGGALVGFAGAKHQTILGQPVLNLYYRFDPAAWGRGYATEAAVAVVGWCRSHRADLPVIARVADNNPASIRVAQRSGLLLQRVHDTADPGAHQIYASAQLQPKRAPS